ncbi:ATP-binding cassette, subfamily B [Albimonas donghaensis]|uniref:ATP-binding cassette, subfamily B n=1 Tax=Albimonas donghaensis TaxID=356660 RepID=A0A1H2RLH5_9RHOB|nr:ATP-binding cassette, subfamily B [Albimonas donghaensis]
MPVTEPSDIPPAAKSAPGHAASGPDAPVASAGGAAASGIEPGETGLPTWIENELERPRARSLGALRHIPGLIAPYRGLAFGAMAMLLVTTVLNLVLPVAAGRVVDGFSEENLALMDAYFLAAFAIAGGLALSTAARFYLVSRLGERVIADLRRQVYDKVIGMSPAFYEKLMTGEVLSRLGNDTTLLMSVVGSTVSVALRNALLFVGGLGMMFWTSPKLTLFGMLMAPVLVFPILIIGRRVRKLSKLTQGALAQSASMASESLLAAQTVQSYTAEDAERARYGGAIEQAYGFAMRRIRARTALTAMIIFLVFSGVVGVMWIGADDLRNGAISPGELVQFLIYSVLVAGATGALSEVWGEMQRAAGATERLIELLEMDDEVRRPDAPTPPAAPALGEVTFDRVRFRYPSRPERLALGDVSFTVAPGETLALVGPSGAGKTTIFQMLMRFYELESGTVSIDGVDIARMDPVALRRGYSVVSQDPAIFANTVEANIRFGRPEATMEEVEAAARAAAAHDFITALPRGYQTYVGERGLMLSGGQKQRLAIARAVLRDAPILLLDEATSALDAESERLVQEALERLSAGRTTLVIAHRLATVKAADRILVMEDGRIVAEGAHDALIAENGLYARFARLQFTDGPAAVG